MTSSRKQPVKLWAIPAIAYFLLLVALNNIYGRFFPNTLGLLGHDFALANPSLLEGAFWFWKNGISAIPWFTPSFCGGQPFFADPQSVYYSPIQWLTFFMPPTQASHAALLVALSMGYWSFYFLARRVFQLSVQASILAGALAMLNGFVPYRFVVGEIGYQAFLLSGFVAHALLSQHSWRVGLNWKFGNIFWAGLAIAFMLNGGLTTLMIPAALGVLVIGILAWLCQKGANFAVFLSRGVAACLFAICLCASKLIASATFMGHFPREAYALPGFPKLVDAVMFPFYSLFLQSQTVWNLAAPKLANKQWAILPHEWAYQFGAIYLIFILVGGGLYLRDSLQSKNSEPTRQRSRKPVIFLSLIALFLILLLPSTLLWYTPEWNKLLKSIPIINTTSFPFRWIIIWIPLGCIAGALIWQTVEKRIAVPKTSFMALLLLLLAILIESTLADKSYYIDPGIQTYDSSLIEQAWKAGKEGDIPFIDQLSDKDRPIALNHPNEALILGQSFIHCYNPSYGYRQETLPVGRLHSGEKTLSEADGHLNIKNPACLIWPEANSCETLGEEYRSSEIEQARRFINREPIDFNITARQKIADNINIAALIITFLMLIGYIPLLLRNIIQLADKR